MFSAEGALLYATGELGADTTLATLGADSLKADAIASGQATGESAIGALTLTRLGSGTTTVLVATLPSAAEMAAAHDASRPRAATRRRSRSAARARAAGARRTRPSRSPAQAEPERRRCRA